jgi:hypothetical protein
MKEVIMKKFLFWMVLIVGIVALIVSCKKSEEESTTAAADNATTTEATFTSTTTAAGSITVGSVAMSGTYVSGCNTSGIAAAIAGGFFPSDVKANRDVIVVTGNDNISEESHFYTDTTCSTLSVYLKNGHDNFTVGDASGDNYKVTYKETGFKIKVGTTVAETYYENDFSTKGITNQGTAINLVVDTEYDLGGSGSSYMNLFSVTSTQVEKAEGQTSSYPTQLDSLEMAKQ